MPSHFAFFLPDPNCFPPHSHQNTFPERHAVTVYDRAQSVDRPAAYLPVFRDVLKAIDLRATVQF